MKDLRNNVVLITGAARGMGRLDAINFGNEGARLVITDLDEKLLGETAEELRSMGYEVHYFRHDISSRSDCFDLAEKVINQVGPVDVLINNAGITRSRGLLDYSEEEYRRITDVNYHGAVWMMQAFIPGMVERRSGHVVNMCSVAGKAGVPFLSPYCGSKAAAIVATDAVRNELKGTGVNFTIISPYFVKTGMFDGAKMLLGLTWQKPEKISLAVLDAVRKNKSEVCMPPFLSRVGAMGRALSLARLFDLAFGLLGGHRICKMMQEDSSRSF